MMRDRQFVVPIVFAFTMLASPVAEATILKSYPAYEPAGGARSRPFLDVLAECRQRFSGEFPFVTAEWSGNYGRTGWWCAFRRPW